MTESNSTFTELFMITIQGSAWMEQQSIPPEYFVFNSESGFARVLPHSLTDGNMELGSRKMVFLMVQNFP